MMRFLHLADVHLDTPFGSRRPELRRRLRRAVREALRRAVDLALEEGVDAVVMAGDLFDGDLLSFETERFLLSQLRRLTEAGVTVVHATGNHDPGREPGRRNRLPWPDGVHVADGPEPVRVPVRDRSGRHVGWVTAVGHATSREADDLSVHFPRPEGSLPEVAVLHAQVDTSRGAEEHDRYAPTTVPALRSLGYDYWALGHVHGRQELLPSPAIHYPGNLQGRTPAESGPRGALLVELAPGEPARVAFHPLAPIRWESLEVGDLLGVESADALIRHVAACWAAWLDGEPEPGAEWMLRIRLDGGTPLWRLLRDEEEKATLEAELGAELGVLEVTIDVDRVRAPVDPGEHVDRDDVLGSALRGLADLVAGHGEPGRFEAELQGWDPRREALEAYLRRVLDGADADLVSRMLRES